MLESCGIVKKAAATEQPAAMLLAFGSVLAPAFASICYDHHDASYDQDDASLVMLQQAHTSSLLLLFWCRASDSIFFTGYAGRGALLAAEAHLDS